MSTRVEIEERLQKKTADIASSFEHLRDEVSLKSVSIRTTIEEKPLASLAAFAGLGLLVGWALFSKRPPKARGTGTKLTRALLEPYVNDVLSDVARRTKDGENVHEAVRGALHRRPPIMTADSVTERTERRRQSAFQALLENAFESALRVVLSRGVGLLRKRFAGEENESNT